MEEFAGVVDSELGEVCGGGGVEEALDVVDESGAAEGAGVGHLVDGPGVVELGWEFGEEHLDGSSGGGEVWAETGRTLGEGFEEEDEEFVEVEGEAEEVAGGDGACDGCEAAGGVGCGGEDGGFAVSEEAGEVVEVGWGHDDPVGPLPGLVRSVGLEVED